MDNAKVMKVFIACLCLAVVSSGVVLAKGGGLSSHSGKQPMNMAQVQSSEELYLEYHSEELLAKHREIDEYVFVDHGQEIEQQGFMVTHTWPQDQHIEIGIAPYSEENAEYLYALFGRDMVKVVAGEKANILPVMDATMKQVVEQFLPLGAKLTIPMDAEQNDSATVVDLNHDGTGEIAAFYRGSDNNIGVLLLQQDDAKWQLKDQISGDGSYLDCVQFYDLDGDGQLEILIGCSFAPDKKLTIYKQVEGKYEELSRIDYTKFAVGDLEGDGTQEIAAIMRVEEDALIPSLRLQVYGLIAGSYQLEYEAVEAGAFPDSVMIGAISDSRQAIIVDMGVGAHSGITEVLIKEDGKYKNPLPAIEDEFPQTFKPYPLVSKDVNNDGIIEIGIQSAPPETEHLPMAATPWINNWYQWDGKEGLVQVMEEYSNYSAGYRFIIPESWHDQYTINTRTDEEIGVSSIEFIYLGADEERAPLLALHHLPKVDGQAQEQQLLSDRSYVVSENDANMVVAQLYENSDQLSDTNVQEYKALLLDPASIGNYFIATRANETAVNFPQRFLELEEQFYSMLFKPETIESTNEIRDYRIKEDLIAAGLKIAERELVTYYVNHYYKEADNKLYIIAQGAPAKILPGSPYACNQIDENTCEIVQDKENVMRGAYRLTVTFTKTDGCWLMSARTTELKNKL